MTRNHIKNSILFLLVLLAFTPAMRAQSMAATAHSIDSLRQRLSTVHTPADSVPIMCNLYDILPRTESTKIGDSIYHTAMRAGDDHTALDILRNQANRSLRNSERLELLTDWTNACHDSNDRRETLTFIRLMVNMNRARYSTPEARKATLEEYLQQIEDIKKDDIYDRIALTHGICMILSDEPNGDLLVSYMDTLGSLIKRLPPNAYSIRNAYNVHAASTFATSHPEKSMVADMNTLNDIKHLEQHYRDHGRKFRNYHSSYYTIYTRLLSNFAILDTAKVEEFYAKAIEQLPYDPAIKNTYDSKPMADIYKAMFYKNYAKALPLLQKVLSNPSNKDHRTQLLRYEIECAWALGDNATLLKAYAAYSKALNAELEERSLSSYRELQTAYAIYDMKVRVGEMEMKRKESEASMQRTIIIISAIALVILVALVIILFSLYRRNRIMAHNLSKINRKLTTESDNLKKSRAELIRARDQAQKANNLKSDFIKNMSYEVKVPLQAINEYSHLIADCAGDAKDGDDAGHQNSMKHLGRFADLIELNSELLSTIIGDVLRLSEIDNESMPLHCQVVNLKTLCEATIDSVEHRVKPGVKLELDPKCDRIDLFTDPTRVQQVLNNLLTNAAKFTDEGSIVLSYHLDPATQQVVFSVTDTGIGINPESKERIFERFVKLDHDTQGAGLGLTIARLIARHLGGDLNLDTTYTSEGSRFVFTLPKK